MLSAGVGVAIPVSVSAPSSLLLAPIPFETSSGKLVPGAENLGLLKAARLLINI